MFFKEEKFLSFAKIFHKRFKPKTNQFLYKIFYICFDISKKKDLKTRLFSVNKFNFFSFNEKDFGDKNLLKFKNNEDWIRDILEKEKINNQVKKIYLLTHCRILGYAFNPVSFWLCFNEKEELIASLAEVNNTFGQSHNYLIFNDDLSKISGDLWHKAMKEFYVSPFFEVKGFYKFKFIFDEKNIKIHINYFIEDELKLATSIEAINYKFCDKNLLKLFFKSPFSNLKIIILIHYQALKLFFKKAKFHKKPIQKKRKLTKNEKI